MSPSVTSHEADAAREHHRDALVHRAVRVELVLGERERHVEREGDDVGEAARRRDRRARGGVPARRDRPGRADVEIDRRRCSSRRSASNTVSIGVCTTALPGTSVASPRRPAALNCTSAVALGSSGRSSRSSFRSACRARSSRLPIGRELETDADSWRLRAARSTKYRVPVSVTFTSVTSRCRSDGPLPATRSNCHCAPCPSGR